MNHIHSFSHSRNSHKSYNSHKKTFTRFTAFVLIGVAALSQSAHAQTLYSVGIFTNPGAIYATSPSGNTTLFTTVPGATGLIDIAINGAGSLFVSNGASDQIFQVNPNTGASSVFATLAPGSNPFGMVFDNSGNLVVCNEASNSLSLVSPTGVVTPWVSVGSLPHDIAKDSSGNFYVACHNDDTIYQVTPGGSVSPFAYTNAPRGVAIDASGNIAVSDGAGYIVTFDSSGVFLNYDYMGSGLYGLTFDAGGNLYGGSWASGSIEQLTPTGTLSTYSTSGVAMTNPSGMAFGSTAAPEPASLSLLALGGLGMLAKRRRNQQGKQGKGE